MRTIRVGEFEWDVHKALANERKHGVSFREAMTAFTDPFAVDAPDIYRAGRFVLIGRSAPGRVLFVVHAEAGERVRIVTARRASRTQRSRYEEG